MSKQNKQSKTVETVKTDEVIETVKTDETDVAAETVTANPFAALTAATPTKSSRKLTYTGPLQDKAREMAVALIKQAGGDAKLAPLATDMLQAKTPETLLAFIQAGIKAEDLTAAAAVLEGCPEDDLPKMLESQRSNRSKAKKTDLTAMTAVVTYVTSMIAELLIREKTGKAYAVGGVKLETDHDKLATDKQALTKRINSLASKQSRLRPLAKLGDANAMAKLAEVEAELKELRAMRPGKTTTTVKSVSVDQMKEALASGSIKLEDLQKLLEAVQQQQADNLELQTVQALPHELDA